MAGKLTKDAGRRAGTCRVCLKSFKPEEFFKMCSECQQKVCEDCASYSKLDENQDESTWSCSICRRKRQSRTQPVITQESTDSLLEVPVLEALQRRHSDVKIGSGSSGNASGSLGGGLAPPRSPELRRHSDVSPASLKEIEKVAGDRRDELRWEREVEWRKKGMPTGSSKTSSPLTERRPPQEESRYPPQTLPSVQAEGNSEDDEDASMQKGNRNRRKSRIGRQHSYDEEIKNAGSNQFPPSESALGLPAALPRRASAYDVYAFRQGESGGHQGTNPNIPPGGRRASFRVVPKQEDPLPYEPQPVVPTPDSVPVSSLAIEDDRRTRRRGSQLPDISNIRGIHQSVPPKGPPRVNPEAIINAEPMRRQPSCDGEAIKIVIDDVDSDATFVSRPGCRKRVVLRRDPGDKTHRTRGFGMRVVGGKASIDGRLFAYIVWTVPGGPAEKAGLQQGDKILEWCGVSLIDRSFEEVCSVMDRTRDVAELLVEHANDLRMCDLLDNPGGIQIPTTTRKSSNAEPTGLTLDSDTDKASTSPTRRKLPKTPV
ncbi:conserved hypothetical protein [Pediculus humanus corporis]|uniref:PDZ domain-containing protein n=1 Tax=Pediculus humanus subsp. corporis TaxID=121224 RepID=E0VGS2_PEDHC|nr:uncharacterized protein Phum_PHUM191370 [Pediculus humanus corporis]EEB12578.1 conserved hypothetical protein [Pediculus humanus corporis]